MIQTRPAGAPRKAMILAAGLGKRMRPITTLTPKPLVRVSGRTLLDRALDAALTGGVEEAIVNVHYMADVVEAHLKKRATPRIVISDERERLLDSGGGVKKALGWLGEEPFWVFNSDTFWLEGPRANLRRMAQSWDPDTTDVLLLLASMSASIGFDGPGDFAMDPGGQLRRRREREVVPFAYAGVMIMTPALILPDDGPAFSLNRVFDRAEAAGRLKGMRLDGTWLHVGTPQGLKDAEAAIAASAR